MSAKDFTAPSGPVWWQVTGLSQDNGVAILLIEPSVRVLAQTWFVAKRLAIVELAKRGIHTDSPVLVMEDW